MTGHGPFVTREGGRREGGRREEGERKGGGREGGREGSCESLLCLTNDCFTISSPVLVGQLARCSLFGSCRVLLHLLEDHLHGWVTQDLLQRVLAVTSTPQPQPTHSLVFQGPALPSSYVSLGHHPACTSAALPLPPEVEGGDGNKAGWLGRVKCVHPPLTLQFGSSSKAFR